MNSDAMRRLEALERAQRRVDFLALAATRGHDPACADAAWTLVEENPDRETFIDAIARAWRIDPDELRAEMALDCSGP